MAVSNAPLRSPLRHKHQAADRFSAPKTCCAKVGPSRRDRLVGCLRRALVFESLPSLLPIYPPPLTNLPIPSGSTVDQVPRTAKKHQLSEDQPKTGHLVHLAHTAIIVIPNMNDEEKDTIAVDQTPAPLRPRRIARNGHTTGESPPEPGGPPPAKRNVICEADQRRTAEPVSQPPSQS